MATAHQFSKFCRTPKAKRSAFTLGSGEIPAFQSVPTTCARAAVKRTHTEGSEAGLDYVLRSRVGEWANHRNKSMATSNRRVVEGLRWYIREDQAHGFQFVAHGVSRPIVMSADRPPLHTTVDVVLRAPEGIVGRVIFWDAPPIAPDDRAALAFPYAKALASAYPGEVVASVQLWQARRQQAVTVSYLDALGAGPAAVRLHSRFLGLVG